MTENRAMRISVVIPVLNSAAELEMALRALHQCPLAPFEIVVVDDGSTDDSAAVAERWGARVVRQVERSGPAAARNRGAAATSGDILFFVDADVCVSPEALDVVTTVFAQDAELAAVIGSYDDAPADPGLISQYKNLSHHYIHQQSRAEASTFWSGCGAVRREVFLKLGGFDECYRRPCIEDIELGYRMRAAGFRIRLEKTLLVKHLKVWKLLGLVRTDVFCRGIPWIMLMLRDRHVVNDLNLTWHSRVGTLLSSLLGLGVLAAALGQCWMVVIAVVAILAAAGAAGWATTRLGGSGGPVGIALGSVILGPAGWGLLSGPREQVWLAAGLLALLLGIVATNAGYYRFFWRKRGGAFACGVLPLHVLFFLYSGLCVPLGILAFYRQGTSGHRKPAAATPLA